MVRPVILGELPSTQIAPVHNLCRWTAEIVAGRGWPGFGASVFRPLCCVIDEATEPARHRFLAQL